MAYIILRNVLCNDNDINSLYVLFCPIKKYLRTTCSENTIHLY